MISNFLYSLLEELKGKDFLFYASSVAAIFSFTGAFLNARKKWYSFAVWAAANIFWVIYDFTIGAYFQSLLFTCYLFMNLYGFYCWKMKDLKFDNEIEQENSPKENRKAA